VLFKALATAGKTAINALTVIKNNRFTNTDRFVVSDAC